MLITVDRLQFVNQKLVCFEFFDINRDLQNKNYIQDKIQQLKNSQTFDIFHLIQYNHLNLNTIYVGEGIDRVKHSFSTFQNWFMQLNNIANNTNAFSKALGSASSTIGDYYVQSLLNAIYANNVHYNNLNFSSDDNGLDLVTKTLAGQSTYGFDFDLYETESRTIIEFLKRENNYVSNLTAHPSRYPGNKKKFISLWNAAQRVNNNSPNLYCVNYSDNEDEAISVLQILDFDTSNNHKMVTSDIGYMLKNKGELIEWLKLLHANPEEASNYLQKKPKEIRDYEFFHEVYNNNKKYLIGKNYK